MKVLVYGAGNIGCLYAALLSKSGQDVSVLARGQRLVDIRANGIQLQDHVTGQRTNARVQVVERLDAEDAYDLVLVVLPRNSVHEVLPSLAANRRTPSIMFFGNNAAGPGELTDALGSDRVLLGFPGAAGVVHDGAIRYLILSAREQPTTIGELDGGRSARIQTMAKALQAAGFPVSISANMDAWLKTHVAEILPTLSAFYMAATDAPRLARTRDALVLMLRAVREGYRVLAAMDVPITPASHRKFQWIPEPLLLAIMRRRVTDDSARIKIGHALGSRAEMQSLAMEFGRLIEGAGVATPSIDELNRYLDADTEPVPDGSAEIPVDWSSVYLALGGVAVVAVALWLMLR